MNIDEVVDFIKQNHKPGKTYLVAIDGRSGSGKSLVAEQLKKEFPNASIIHLDTFEMYDGEPSNKKVISEVLIPLENDQSGKIIIIEGVFALNRSLESYYDCKIWIECPAKLGFERGLARDISLNGIDNSDKWLNYWMPKEEEYIKAENPSAKADFIIDGTKLIS